ncbi:hypothetical protein [Streptomyces canus]|uniref:hypothetical protein n=1 Tax=Streptomyces canus TaxID=58343 RepID=UPI003247ECA6
MPWLELRMREGGMGGVDVARDRGALAGVARRAEPPRQGRRRCGGRPGTGGARQLALDDVLDLVVPETADRHEKAAGG